MTILSSGPVCDVCDSYILLDKSINPFTVTGIDQELHCHDKCKDKVIMAMEAHDWQSLPEGALRRTFALHFQEPKENTK